tara:strand:- start:314 stop:898 length:585 start_codon:yes stop_codon:yes gene_type:complete
MEFVLEYIKSLDKINKSLDILELEKFILCLSALKKRKGRLFILGVGGSAGNASHAVNDFRKLCEIETYSPTDNVSEITARTNDEGFATIFSSYLKISKLSKKDLVLIFSVGGGNLKKNVSLNLIEAIKLARKKKCKILSILGKKDGYAAKYSDHKIVINTSNKKLLTPLSESYQAIVWHLLVSHPKIQTNKTKW